MIWTGPVRRAGLRQGVAGTQGLGPRGFAWVRYDVRRSAWVRCGRCGLVRCRPQGHGEASIGAAGAVGLGGQRNGSVRYGMAGTPLPPDYDITTLVCDSCQYFKVWCTCGGTSWTSFIFGDHFEGYEEPESP